MGTERDGEILRGCGDRGIRLGIGAGGSLDSDGDDLRKGSFGKEGDRDISLGTEGVRGSRGDW